MAEKVAAQYFITDTNKYVTVAAADGMGDKQQIADRVAQIRAQLSEEKSEFEKENLQERLAKIAGGVAAAPPVFEQVQPELTEEQQAENEKSVLDDLEMFG